MHKIETMIEQARITMQNAYSPYSKFKVGACLRAEDGQLYSGCNVENASYGVSQCAEASAIGKLISAGQKKILEVAIITSGKTFCPPCGACRQRLSEFAQKDTLIHMATADGNYKTMTMAELLPYMFSANDFQN